MTNKRILQIIKEETVYQEGIFFEGMTYVPQQGYRNNSLLMEADDESSTWDTVQKVLGIAGFIPVIGDFIDVINGLIYVMRKQLIEGMFSLVAAIPGIGSPIAKSIQLVFNKIGKPFMNVFQMIFKNGKGAGVALFELIAKQGKWVKETIAPLFLKFQELATDIITILNKLKFTEWNNAVLKYTGGWIGAPAWAMKALDGFVNQLKGFFGHMANPPSALVHVTHKKIERTAHGLLPHEQEKIVEKYNDGTVDKKDYPTVDDFIKAQVNLKNKKEEKVELKLWSSGPLVEKLQKILKLKVDGKFGEGTELAVKKWQKKNKLTPDGVVGPDTWAKMT